MTSGRIIGILLIVAAIIIGLIGAAWLVAGVVSQRMLITGAILGGALLSLPILLLLGGGIFLLVRSGREAKTDAERETLRRILDMVSSRGQIPISDLVLELASTRVQVQRQVHTLVGMGVFSGYVNWDEGVLYSAEAASLRDLDRCKHCGGELKLVGKGVISCPFCGTEYFLP
ncbi:MAG: hypothetical protein PVI78_10495 [Anaerolineales bacterium]